MAAKLRVTLIKSPISHTQRTRATMSALGLHRIGQSVVVDDTPEMRGQVRAIRFLLRTEPAEGTDSAEKSSARSAAPKKEASKS